MRLARDAPRVVHRAVGNLAHIRSTLGFPETHLGPSHLGVELIFTLLLPGEKLLSILLLGVLRARLEETLAVVPRRLVDGGGEIDLVLTLDGMLVFVEVKTRGPRCPVPPENWVTRRQLGRLRRMARIWLSENSGRSWRGYRFDVVAVAYGGKEGGSEIRHLVGVG